MSEVRIVEREAFRRANAHKASFDAIYVSEDPRLYYSVLCGLNYVIPEVARPVIAQLIDHAAERHGRPPRIVDLGCSYGINAALAKFPLDLDRLARRYAEPLIQTLDAEALAALDRNFFAGWPRRTDATFVGVDASAPAIAYATKVGLLDAGVVADFETRDPRPEERALLAGADLIVSTGCVGYVTNQTFARLLAAIGSGRRPWIASFVLRMFPFDGIARTLEHCGLLTEKLENVTFVQRRFSDEGEFRDTVEAVRARGLDTRGKEEDGLFHAEFYLSRPAEDIERWPIASLFDVVSGQGRPYGRRYHRIDDRDVQLLPY
jgi:SAM-dependent methyltransferase